MFPTDRCQRKSSLREALIRSVEKRERLWEKIPEVGRDIDMKAKLWKEVVEELMEQFGVLIDVEDMKRIWKHLKGNYWRIVKTFDTESERATRWKLYEAMRFMERANSGEPSSPRGCGFDPYNAPSSSGGNTQRSRTAQELLNETNIKDSCLPSPGQSTMSDEPPQLKRMSERGRKRVRRDFVQISIPELDRLINTKQRPALGTQIQCVPVDPTQDNLTSEMELVWKQLDEEAIAKLTAERAMRANLNNEEQATEWICSILPEIEKSERKRRITTDFDNKFVDLIKIAQSNCDLNDKTRSMVTDRAACLRGIYHQGAFALFVKQGMPQGQLQKLLDAFDDFVYDQKPRDPVISEVIKECDPSVHSAFVALFSIIERYAFKLGRRHCWAQVDKEFKSEVNRPRDKTRRMYDVTDPDDVTLQRMSDTRAVLAKKIKQYTAAVYSTKDLLSLVEHDDLDTREELEDTLKRNQDMLEKTTQEQLELIVLHRKFQTKVTKARMRRMAADTALEPGELIALAPATDILRNKETKPNVTELFDSTVKKEPQ
ncbi:hypothetical protein Aduo_002544 [Ancylostoma duodenale]